MSQKKIKTNKILYNYNMNEKEKQKQPYMSKSGEKNNPLYKRNNDVVFKNSYMENLLSNTEFSSEYPYNCMSDSRDKNPNMNIYKTISSQEESTNNHMSLIQESNEIQKPKNSINLTVKNKKNYFSPDKTYKIAHPNNTEKIPKKYIHPQNLQNNENNLIPYSYNSHTNVQNYPVPYNNNIPEFMMKGRKTENNNIYLYSNENEYNYNDNNTYKDYINKPQYYNNTTFNNYNLYNNTEVKKNNPLYERMRLNKINSNFKNFYSPFSKKSIYEDRNNKNIYNQNNRIYNYPDSEEYNINSYYEKETMDNNYNIRNIYN